jgi:hypothetical protein
VSVIALALGFVLLQAAAATPAPSTPTPTPTPRRATAGPRTLQDVARDLKLGGGKGKGTIGTISAGPSTQSAAPAATPEAAAGAAPTPEPEAASTASVRVTNVTNDGVVDPSGGVRVNGTVKNGGFKAACNVVITVKIMDSRGIYLASGQTAPDTAVIPPGEVVSFRTIVQAPPGVRGARTNPDRKDTTDGSTTMAGDWKLLGGTEASVANASEDCIK